MKIIELARWNDGSMGKIEEALKQEVGIGNIAPINGASVEDIFRHKGLNIKCGDPAKLYYVYFNLHHSSGHRTMFDLTKDNRIKLKVIEPKGGSFQAFFTEVVILEIK